MQHGALNYRLDLAGITNGGLILVTGSCVRHQTNVVAGKGTARKSENGGVKQKADFRVSSIQGSKKNCTKTMRRTKTNMSKNC